MSKASDLLKDAAAALREQPRYDATSVYTHFPELGYEDKATGTICQTAAAIIVGDIDVDLYDLQQLVDYIGDVLAADASG